MATTIPNRPLTNEEVLLESLMKMKERQGPSNLVGEEFVPPVQQILKEEKQLNDQGGAINVFGAQTEAKPVQAAPVAPPAPKSIVPAEVAPAPVERKVEAPKPEGTRQYVSPAVNTSSTTIKETVAPNLPEGPSVWERAMIGATPLLVGLLTGNRLEGVQTSGNYFVTEESDRFKREKDVFQKLTEMQAKREIATKSAKPEIFTYRGSDGVDRLGRFINGQQIVDEVNDPLAPVKETKGSWQKVTVWDEKANAYVEKLVNPSAGEEVVAGKAQPKFRPDYKQLPTLTANGELKYQTIEDNQSTGFLPGQVPPKAATTREDGRDRRFDEAQMNRVVESVRSKNSKFSLAQEDALNIVKAADMLNKPNPFSDEGVKTFLARSVFAEKGPLSDFDLARLAGSGAIDEVAVRNIQRWRDGNRITDNDAIAMRQVLESVHPYIKAKATGEIEATIRAYPQYPELGARLQAYTKGNFPELPKWTNPKRDGVAVDKSVRGTMKGNRKVLVNDQGVRLEIPLSDKQAISDAMKDGFTEIK